MSITHCTFPLATCTILFVEHTATLCRFLPSLPYRTVSPLVRVVKKEPYLNISSDSDLWRDLLADRQDKDTHAFRAFKRQLYHTSVSAILDPLRPGTTTPEVLRCPDAHFCRAIYGIACNIMDYPEQAQAAGIVEGWCPGCVKVLCESITSTHERDPPDVLVPMMT